MSIVIDKRKTKIIYVDKENNHVGKGDEVMKLISVCGMSPIDTYVAIIAGGLKLNETEVTVLKYIIKNNGTKLMGQICIEVSKTINKSTATVSRAISYLRNKKLIYGGGAKVVKLSASINTSIDALDKVKFIVVEVEPKITSNGIL